MGIREDLGLLAELGHVDQKLSEARDRLRLLPAKAEAARTQADAMLVEVKNLEKKSKDLQDERKGKETEIFAGRSNLRKWEERADRIKGERDYTALMSEIGAQKRLISQREDEILELLEKIEESTKRFDLISEQQKQTQAKADQEWSAIQEETDKVRLEVDALAQVRDTVLAKLPKDILSKYNRIAERRSGRGIAFVRKEVCQECMRTVPPEFFNRVINAEVIEQCPSCHRLLVSADLLFQNTSDL